MDNLESLAVPLTMLCGIVFFVGMQIAGALNRIARNQEAKIRLEHPKEADRFLPKK